MAWHIESQEMIHLGMQLIQMYNSEQPILIAEYVQWTNLRYCPCYTCPNNYQPLVHWCTPYKIIPSRPNSAEEGSKMNSTLFVEIGCPPWDCVHSHMWKSFQSSRDIGQHQPDQQCFHKGRPRWAQCSGPSSKWSWTVNIEDLVTHSDSSPISGWTGRENEQDVLQTAITCHFTAQVPEQFIAWEMNPWAIILK